MSLEIEPIGTIEAGRSEASDDFWGGSVASVVLHERFPAEALQGIEDFSHVEILFHFHLVPEEKVVSAARHPRGNRDWPAVGIFAQRGKARPNRIGSTICRVVSRDGRRLRVAELDAIDGTPVVDVKPVMREFLPRGEVAQPDWSRELMRAYWSPEEERGACPD